MSSMATEIWPTVRKKDGNRPNLDFHQKCDCFSDPYLANIDLKPLLVQIGPKVVRPTLVFVLPPFWATRDVPIDRLYFLRQ